MNFSDIEIQLRVKGAYRRFQPTDSCRDSLLEKVKFTLYQPKLTPVSWSLSRRNWKRDYGFSSVTTTQFTLWLPLVQEWITGKL